MAQIILNSDEIIDTKRKTVSSQGQISVGTEHAGKKVTVYVVEEVAQ